MLKMPSEAILVS